MRKLSMGNPRLALSVASLLALVTVSPALAYIVAPTSITISTVKAFRNLAETGDILILFHYSMPYASDNYSTTPASESIMFRLIAADNTTVLQTGAPYVSPFFESNGYGEGVGSFYLDAASAFTWEDAVTVNIIEMPAYFSPSANKTYTLSTTDYVTVTTQEDNRALVKTYVLLECDKLAASYASTSIILKSTSDMGIILSPYGDLYFRGAIPGLQALAPELFFVQTLIPEPMTTATSYNMTGASPYTARLAGDDLGVGFTNIGVQFGVGGAFAAAAITFLASLVFCIYAEHKNWGVELGMLVSAAVVVGMALLVGDIVYSLMMIGALIAAMGIIWVTLLKKA